MADARGFTVTVRVGATSADGRDAEFTSSGTVITQRGFLAAYEEGRDDDAFAAAGDDDERRLPALKVGDALAVRALEAEGHSTQPPCPLHRGLAGQGLGGARHRAARRPTPRSWGPSSTAGTSGRRAARSCRHSSPSPSSGLLEKHFGELVDYDFTARMEEVLDGVADGDAERVDTLRRFYYGSGNGPDGALPGPRPDPRRPRDLPRPASDGRRPRRDRREEHQHDRDRRGHHAARREVRPLPRARDRPGRERRADHAARLGAGGPRAGRADGRPRPRSSSPSRPATASSGPTRWPGRRSWRRSAGSGPYVTEVLPEGAPKSAKPRTASLFKDMSLDTVNLDDALRLLLAAARGRHRPGGRRGDHRPERPLRAVHQEGQ